MLELTQGQYYGSSHTFNSSANVKAGNTVIVIISKNDNDSVSSYSSGWEQLYHTTGKTAMLSAAYAKVAQEDGVQSLYLTHDTEETMWMMLVIPNGRNAQAASYGYTSATSTPNPPTLTPISNDEGQAVLWIAVAAWSYDRHLTTYPSGWTENQAYEEYDACGGLAIATMITTDASMNPGAFTLDGSWYAVAATIGVAIPANETAYIADARSALLRQGLSASCNLYKYKDYDDDVLGETVATELVIDYVEDHPTQDNTLLITTHGSFRNIAGDITVAYDAAEGFLIGLGGPVASFSGGFTPDELGPDYNPYMDVDTVAATLESIDLSLTPITYKDGYGAGDNAIVDVSLADLSLVLTHIDDLNP